MEAKVAMTGDGVVSGLILPLWEEVLWPFLDAWDSVRLRTTSTQWNVPGRYGVRRASSFSLGRKSRWPSGSWFRFGASIPVRSSEACALVGLHMMAEENSWRIGKWLLCVVKQFG